MTKIKLSLKGHHQGTLLGPLWARATFSAKYPELLNDPKASEIIKKIDFDFSKVKEFLSGFLALGLLARAKNFDNVLKKYIEKHPYATVVNIGAGLDTTFSRLDNSKIKWYDLDFPEVIQFRKRFIPETPRYNYISKSAFDYSWFDDVDFKLENGVFFIAGGFVHYFKEEEISTLIIAMVERFPGGELIFDASSKLANKIFNRRLKEKVGNKGQYLIFGLDNPIKQISKWSDKIQVVDWFTLWSRINRNPQWSKEILKEIELYERTKVAKIVHVRFLK